ncbi:UNVERIFIED_CONTAM: hypothetical protein Sindi_1601800 [Sesamum indicum]
MSAKHCLILLFAIVFLIANSSSLPINHDNSKVTNDDKKNNDIGPLSAVSPADDDGTIEPARRSGSLWLTWPPKPPQN